MVALISLGLMIILTWSFLITSAETEAPILSVGDQWSYGWFNGEFTNETGEVGGHLMTVTVDRMEDFEGVSCYVCLYEFRPDEHMNQTYSVWMTSDWVVLKTEEYIIYDFAETRITFIYSPGMKLYDFPLTVGKEWSDRSYRTIEQIWYGENEENGTAVDYIDWSWKVVSTGNVTVPAGTFDVYGIENICAVWEPWMGGIGQTCYFSLDVKNRVKSEVIGMGGGGDVLTDYILALQGSEQENGSSNIPLMIIFAAAIGVLGIVFIVYSRRNHRTIDM